IEDDGIFGFEADTKRYADCNPPPRIAGFEKSDDEICGENPPEEIERGVLKLVAFKDGERGKADGECRSDLREPRAAEFLGHEAGEDDNRELRGDRGEAETNDRDAEEREGDVLDEWRERGIGDESPVEMTRIGKELKLVAMEAVSIVGEQMKQRESGGDGEE